MTRHRSAATQALVVLGAVVALTACGSTVPAAEQQAGPGAGLQQAVDGPSAAGAGAATSPDAGPPALDATAAGPGTSEPGAASGAAGGVGTGAPVRTATGSGTASGATSAGGTTGAGPAGTAPRTGAGAKADRSPVTVAVFHLNGGNQVLSAAFPGSSVSFGDGKREATAVIEDLNRRGGAGGHPVVPKFVPVEASNANNTGLQQACQGAVQDYKPMAIFAMFNLAEGLSSCAKKYGVLLVDVALGAGDDGLYAGARDIAFSPSQISRDAEQRLVLGLAHAAGTLERGKTVGILVQGDDPSYGRVAKKTIEPLLRSYGVPFVTQSISTGADTNGINAAILKFSSSKAETVVFSLGNGGIPEVLFMQSAEQQQYRPAYLMGDSTNTSFVGNQAPRNQVKRISGAGTYPLANVAPGEYPSSAAEKRCLQILDKAIGGYRDRSTSLTGTLYCELVESFAYVAARVQGPLTTASWAAAYHRSGTGYTPVTTFRTAFVPGRPDGASAYRQLGYAASCTCITYTSPVRPVPAS